MRSLTVRVLGDFSVDGIEPHAFGSRKARLVLQLLAVAGGQAVPPDVLIDALWGTAPPARPEDQLAVLVSPAAFGPGPRPDRASRPRLPAALRLAGRDRTGGAHPGGGIAARGRPRDGRRRGSPDRALADPRRWPAAAAGRVGPAQARRARAAGQPCPPGGGHRATRGWRLDGGARRRVGCRRTRSLRRSGPARAAARLCAGRPGGRGAGHLRQRAGADSRRARHRSVARDHRPLHRDPAR